MILSNYRFVCIQEPPYKLFFSAKSTSNVRAEIQTTVIWEMFIVKIFSWGGRTTKIKRTKICI